MMLFGVSSSTFPLYAIIMPTVYLWLIYTSWYVRFCFCIFNSRIYKTR